MAEETAKVYVQVSVEFESDGTMVPREITWEDGTIYRVDRVTDIRRAAALRAGGLGDRYTVLVSGKKTFLFFERICSNTGAKLGRWFVERRSA